MRTTALRGTTVRSPNVPMPSPSAIGPSGPCSGDTWPARAIRATVHSCGWPPRHSAHDPHGGIQTRMT